MAGLGVLQRVAPVLAGAFGTFSLAGAAAGVIYVAPDAYSLGCLAAKRTESPEQGAYLNIARSHVIGAVFVAGAAPGAAVVGAGASVLVMSRMASALYVGASEMASELGVMLGRRK